ncbi:hypothetical protein B296_00028928 [Ensete ventricosum]|uniref:Glycosyltransferase 61 catalytic domain-containing protein n=1 Tax=Ensete ventricosum TaxID=4639 RepID=A0A426XPE1_ENSVE|nr:hypothetical protein B296_00028928 [Ensete ventricosum]
MKSLRAPPRLEPRRMGNALIVAAMLLSLCILSLIKARYCSAPDGLSLSLSLSRNLELVFSRNACCCFVLLAAKLRSLAQVEPIEVSESVAAKSWEAALPAEGDARLRGSSRTIFLHPSLTDREWKIKPYCRKHDGPAMKNIEEWTLKPLASNEPPPRCTVHHKVPALVFSIGGFTGNLFHDFTDVIVPLFISSYQFHGEVQFVVSENKPWWVSKFISILNQLSNYDIIDADDDDPDAVRCFPRVIVGLSFHKELGVDPSKTATGYSMVEFKAMLRKAYGLERPTAAPWGDRWDTRRKPRLLIISRRKTRVFLNERGMADMATSLGFAVRVAEPDNTTDLAKFARLVNSADVMIGVHGAGLTNMVFLPAGAVLIQVVPMGGLGWVARDTFKKPSSDMQLKYMDYHIKADESSLIDQYPKNHPVLKDPDSIQKQGWYTTSKIYLENQNVRPHLRRLRNTLLEALRHLPHGRKEA